MEIYKVDILSKYSRSLRRHQIRYPISGVLRTMLGYRARTRQFHKMENHDFDTMAWLDSSLQKAFSLMGRNMYVFTLKGPDVPSRILRYYGVFPRGGRIKEGDYIEEQILVEPGIAVLAGICPVTKDNIQEALRVGWGVGTSTIFFSRDPVEQVLSATVVRDLVSATVMNQWQVYEIPFVALVKRRRDFFLFHDNPKAGYEICTLFTGKDCIDEEDELLTTISNIVD